MEHAAQCLQADKKPVLFEKELCFGTVCDVRRLLQSTFSIFHFIIAPKQEWRTSSFHSRPKHKLPEY